jgi:hypothetical protein
MPCAGVADERHAMGDRRAQPRRAEAESPAAGVIRFERAEGVPAARGNPRGKRVRRQLEKLARKRLGADQTIDTRRPGSGSQASTPPSS